MIPAKRLTWLVAACAVMATCALAQEPKRFEVMGIGGGGGMFSPIGSPHDPRLCFVSCDMGGFYVSTDGGQNWWMVDRFEMVGSTECRPAFHPTDANIVYMPMRAQGELRISNDRGRHWKTLCADAPWKTARVNAVNTDRGGDGNLIFVCAKDGLYRSTDGGRTFGKSDGVAGDVIGAHVDQTRPKASRRVIAGSSDGVFVSTDGGKTFEKKGAGIDGRLSGFSAGSDATTRKVICYAVTAKAAYVSDDAGASFRKVLSPPSGDFVFACMAENHPEICYVTTTGNWGVHKTVDGGKTWQSVFRMTGPGKNVRWGWLATDISAGWGGEAIGFGVNPAFPDGAMFTNSGELFMTADGGKSWEQAMSRQADPGEPKPGMRWASNGLEVTTVWSYVFDPFDANRVYVCYTDIGFIRSTDRGATWYLSVKSSPWENTFYNLQFDPARRGVLYAAAANQHDIPGWANTEAARGAGGVVMSADFGATWTPISNGLPAKGKPCTCVLLDPDSPADRRTLYAALFGDGVYKSIDGGKSWTRKSNGLGRPGNDHVSLVRLGPDKTLYALVTGKHKDLDFPVSGGLWKSTDGAETWVEVTQGIDLWWPTEFAVHPKDPNRIWIATCDVPVKKNGGLFVTSDGGKTWKQTLSQDDFDKKVIPYVHLFAIAFDPRNADVMYLSSWTHGLFRSEDAGKTWKRIEGIPSEVSINRVSFDPKDMDTIYVTTYGKGIWRGPAKGY